MSTLRKRVAATLELSNGAVMDVELSIAYVPTAQGINLVDTIITAFTGEGLMALKRYVEDFERGQNPDAI